MPSLGRRQFLACAAGATAAVTLRAPHVCAQKRGGTLRVMPHADLKSVDPIWTTAYISRNHGYMVYDTLFATDASLQIKPQMVEKYTVSPDQRKYTFTLRDGLRFHDGQPVTAEDCVASLQRWGKRDALGTLLTAATETLRAVDKKTLALELGSPFGLVLDALGKPSSNVPFIMPARLAATSDTEQIKESIGSGPFRFVQGEWQPGNQAVYERNPDYVPRNEPPSGATGGKRVYLDRVIWRHLPDPGTVVAALEAGEIDYWEAPGLDFTPRLEKNPNLAVIVTDPRGNTGWLRPNHLHPPFNNKKARQALLYMIDQDMVLQGGIGQAKYFQSCPAYFLCGDGLPYQSAAGAPGKVDFERAKQLLKEGGYDGKPVVLMDPTDYPTIHGPTLVIRELLQKGGLNVDLAAMDWGSLISRRAKKDPPQAGGWNLFVTWWISADALTPAVNAGLRGSGEKAWFGWPTIPELDRLRAEWVRAAEPAKKKQIAEQIQTVAYDEVPYVLWGQFRQPTAYRKTAQGVLNFACAVFWNISLTT
jgi:peptide/nickel transport system substrate-binding protein